MADRQNHRPLTDALDDALARFGTRSFYDKGADEIMDVDPLVDQLASQAPQLVADQLDDLCRHDHGEALADVLWSRLVEDNRHPQGDLLAAATVHMRPQGAPVRIHTRNMTHEIDRRRDVRS